MIKSIYLYISVFLGVLLVPTLGYSQCFPGKVVTAQVATGGTSKYLENVLWLTWGSDDQVNFPYGKPGVELIVGSTSYASISMGEDRYMCIEAKIVKITPIGNAAESSKKIASYAPGDYSGDFLPELYNIGGTGKSNKLISGIVNTEGQGGAVVTIECKATIDGVPIRIPGVVLADAESLSGGIYTSSGEPTGEHIYARAKGEWSVVEAYKNPSVTKGYHVRKEDHSATDQEIKFLGGTDQKTGVVAFLTFNETAYNSAGSNPDEKVSMTTTIKGGKTAVAIGLINPVFDFGDAPESYGAPIHGLPTLSFSHDNISSVPANASNAVKASATVNINASTYQPAGLISEAEGYLGTTPPDADEHFLFSDDALGDDKDPVENPTLNEEDAWPVEFRRVSYKTLYNKEQLTVAIAYKNAKQNSQISGWIDFNANGKFDDNERATTFITASGSGWVNLVWNIPKNPTFSNTFVRLRYFDVSEKDNLSPTSYANLGEVEDHKIFILSPSGVNSAIPLRAKPTN